MQHMRCSQFRCSMVGRFLGIFLLSQLSSAGAPIEVVISPKPQSTSSTCQSYCLAFAVASVDKSPYSATTASELRDLEKELRGKLEAVAKRRGLTEEHHAVWIEAISEFTSGSMVLEKNEYADIVSFMEAVAKATGVTNADTLGPELTTAIAKHPVLTSVTSLNGDSYATGHIVSILGTSGNLRSADAQLLILNSAVKAPDPGKLTCDIDDLPGDSMYSAVASLTKDFELKRFGGKFVLFSVHSVH